MKATHCKRGHLRTPETLRPNGTCRECARLVERERRDAARGGPPQAIDPNWFPCGHPRTPENTKGGHAACKTCNRESQLNRYRADPERHLAAALAYQKANREAATLRQTKWKRDNAERYQASYRAYRERTREHRRAVQRAWAEANREAHAAYNAAYGRRWRAENPDRARLGVQNRLRRQRNHPDFVKVSFRDWNRTINRYQGRCAYCGAKPDALQMDHVVPISRGGRHGIGNIVPACRACNASKGSKFLAVWRYKYLPLARRLAS